MPAFNFCSAFDLPIKHVMTVLLEYITRSLNTSQTYGLIFAFSRLSNDSNYTNRIGGPAPIS